MRVRRRVSMGARMRVRVCMKVNRCRAGSGDGVSEREGVGEGA